MYKKYCLATALLIILAPCVTVLSTLTPWMIFGIIYSLCLYGFYKSKIGQECWENFKKDTGIDDENEF